MSAFVGVLKRQSIEVLSDAAQTRRDGGALLGVGSKLTTVAGMSCVIAMRGAINGGVRGVHSHGAILGLVAASLCNSFDAVVGRFDEVHGIAKVSFRKWFGRYPYEFLLAGWSEVRNRPQMYLYQCRETPLAQRFNSTAGQLQVVGDMAIGGAGGSWEEVLAHGWSSPENEEAFDPRRDGLALFEATRRAPMGFGGVSPGFRVGGFVELATVTRGGVHREIIHRWPDAIGKPIDPKIAA